MPKPYPAPPDYTPTPDVVAVLDAARALTAGPAGTADDYTRSIPALQWLQQRIAEEWQRELARAQGGAPPWQSGVMGHARLSEITGYSAGTRNPDSKSKAYHARGVQNRVYEGRALIEADAAANVREAG